MAAKDLSQAFRTQGPFPRIPLRPPPPPQRNLKKRMRSPMKKRMRTTGPKIIVITQKVACFSSRSFYSAPQFSVVRNELYLYVRSEFFCKNFVFPVTLSVRVGISPTSGRSCIVVAWYDATVNGDVSFYTNRPHFRFCLKFSGTSACMVRSRLQILQMWLQPSGCDFCDSCSGFCNYKF